MSVHYNRFKSAALGCVALAALVVSSFDMARAQSATDPGETAAAAIERLTARGRGARTVALSELGIRRSIVLNGMDARRDLFLPVPAGVPIRDARVDLEGRYLRGEGGRTTYVAAVDSVPVLSRAVTEDQGAVSATLPVTGEPRPSGFVNLNIAWSSVVGRDLCDDERSIGNVLEIDPATRFTYSYDTAAIRDIATAWSALPTKPVILVPNGTLPQEVYDAAWRIGVVLARGGKTAQIRTLPRIGDEVDTTGLAVPAALQAVGPFQSLARGGRVRIASDAEVGALLLLQRQAGLEADIVIGSDSYRAQTEAALQALEGQIAGLSTDAAANIAKWRAESRTAVVEVNDTIRLLPGAGHPVIAITAQGGGNAAGFLSELWRPLGLVPAVRVAAANGPDFANAPSLPLSLLAAAPAASTFWPAASGAPRSTCPPPSPAGGFPKASSLTSSAAPGAGTSPAIASCVLQRLPARRPQPTADGRPERIAVSVPNYALLARNTLRVVVQRQPVSDRCREVPQAFPVAVLPSSRVMLAQAPSAVSFIGVMPRLSDKATLVIPRAYLADPATLGRVISLAYAAGVPPERSDFTVVADGAEARPENAFLAVDARVAGVEGKVHVEGGRLVLNGSGNRPMLDVSGLSRLGVAEAVKSGDRYGVVYRTIGQEAPFSIRTSCSDAAMSPRSRPTERWSRSTRNPPTASRRDGARSLQHLHPGRPFLRRHRDRRRHHRLPSLRAACHTGAPCGVQAAVRRDPEGRQHAVFPDLRGRRILRRPGMGRCRDGDRHRHLQPR